MLALRRRQSSYLLNHFLDQLVGGFQVLWVRAVQQAGQHLAGRESHMGERVHQTHTKTNTVTMLAPELKETKRIRSHLDNCPRNKHLLTFDFSSSSKMAFLGLGGGRFSSLSAGRSGSCLMIPDGQRRNEQPSAGTETFSEGLV